MATSNAATTLLGTTINDKATPKMSDRRCYTYRILSLVIDIGGRMYRTAFITEAEKRNGTVQAFLVHHRSSINKKGRSGKRKLISKPQFDTMFPDGSLTASSADDFDITLLAFLLRNMCASVVEKEIWQKKLDTLDSTNVSNVADLVRLREYRNKVMHEVTDTKTAFTEKEFNDLWKDLTEVINRLQGTYRIPDLNILIDEIENKPLDKQREGELQKNIEELKTELQRWMDMDDEMFNAIMYIKNKLEANVPDMSLKREQLESERKKFVKTNAFNAAKEKLRKKNIVILTGNAGEGKTTMANMLLFEIENGERVWNVHSCKHWSEIDIKDNDVFIIDDIFGTSVFDLDESRNWRNTFNNMFTAVEDKNRQISIIITCRNYIMSEALDKAYYPSLTQEEYVQTLELEKDERKKILLKHLDEACEERNDTYIEECLKYFDDTCVFPIGFPESVRLFCSNKDLLEKGPEFFKQPYRYIRDIVREFFRKDKDVTFSAFFLLWAQTEVKVRDLERPLNSIPHITKLLDKLQLQTYNVHKIREHLRHHRNDFVKLDRESGVYTLKHKVIADVVGIVSYEFNPTAVLECCDFDFAMKYLTAETEEEDNVCVVEQYRFDQLSQCLIRILKAENGKIPGAPLEHKAFFNKNFCNKFFIEAKAHGVILSAPVHVEDGTNPKDLFSEYGIEIRPTEFRIASYSIWKTEGMTYIADEWFRAKTCSSNIIHSTESSHDGQNRKVQNGKSVACSNKIGTTRLANVDPNAKEDTSPGEDALNADLYLSVMLAIKYVNLSLLKDLLKYGTMVTDDIIIFAWVQRSSKKKKTEYQTGKANEEILQSICKHSENGKNVEQSTRLIRRKNKHPLISLIQEGKEHAVIALIHCGKQYRYLTEDNEKTVLHFACEKGQTDIAMSILKDFEELDIKDEKGFFPIHYATRGGHVDTVKAILDKDISQADRTLTADEKWLNGATLLHIAVDMEHTNMIEYLTEKREFPVDNMQRTPLMFALRNGKYKSGYTLVQSENVDKETPDKDGKTPLNVACECGWLEIVDKLLEYDSIKQYCMNTMQDGLYSMQYAIINIQEEICRRYYLDL